MHTYSIGGSIEKSRKKIILWIFCTSIVLCTLGNLLFDALKDHYPTVFIGIDNFFSQWPWLGISVGSISAFTIFGLLFWLYDKLLWKISWVRKYTGVPNFSGTWEGVLRTSFDASLEIQMTTTIEQTWSKIKVHSNFHNPQNHEDTRSFSDSAHIEPDYGLGPLLKFTYANRSNDPSLKVREHRGENELILLDYDCGSKTYQKLCGDYYNNRENGNVGTIALHRR